MTYKKFESWNSFLHTVRKHLDVELKENPTKYNFSSIEEGLPIAIEDVQLFYIHPEFNNLFFNTIPPKKKTPYLFFPFKDIFFDFILNLNNEYDIRGIHVIGIIENENKQYYADFYFNNLETNKLIRIRLSYDTNKDCFEDGYNSFNQNDFNKNHEYYSEYFFICKKYKKQMIKYLKNLLLFLNEPRVKLQIIQREGRNKRLEKRNIIPPPSEIVTILSNDLKKEIRYITHQSSHTLGYQYKVCGHWRYLASPRYKERRFKYIYIAPHRKGNGLEVPQTFELKNNKVK